MANEKQLYKQVLIDGLPEDQLVPAVIIFFRPKDTLIHGENWDQTEMITQESERNRTIRRITKDEGMEVHEEWFEVPSKYFKTYSDKF